MQLPDYSEYTFGEWLDSTDALQKEAYGLDWASFVVQGKLTEEGREVFVSRGVFPAMVELAELSREVGWKPWATNRIVDRAKVIDEAVDVMHFVANILVMVGCTGEDLTDRYRAKQMKNLQRQQQGYDGSSSGCPNCRRPLAEASRRTVGLDHREYCSPSCAEENSIDHR